MKDHTWKRKRHIPKRNASEQAASRARTMERMTNNQTSTVIPLERRVETPMPGIAEETDGKPRFPPLNLGNPRL